MAKIKWIGIIKEACAPVAVLPESAKRIDEPENPTELQKKALPYGAVSLALCIAVMLVKTISAGARTVNPFAILLFIILFLPIMLFLHEIMHAIVYPPEAMAEIGFAPKHFAAMVLVSHPLSRRRFLLSTLAPAALGIIPLVLFIITPPSWHFLNSLTFSLYCIGFITPYPDYFMAVNILRQVPKNAVVQFSGDRTYWFSGDGR